MSLELRSQIYEELSSFDFIDPHTHIDALKPASETLADILGYHYYTELAHSAGMSREAIEEADLDPKEKVERLVSNLEPLQNTIQYSWFIEMAQEFFGFQDDVINRDNWEALYNLASDHMSKSDWADQVLKKSRLKGVFLTNDFDDPLDGFDTNIYIPCLRTDDLVFHLGKPEVRKRFAESTGQEAGTTESVRAGTLQLFRTFVA